MKTKRAFAGIGLSEALTGCCSIGPGSFARERLDCSSSSDESWKCQTLFNFVKPHYPDPPFFVEVAQLFSGYIFHITAFAVAGVNRLGDCMLFKSTVSAVTIPA